LVRCGSLFLAQTASSRQRGKMSAMEAKPDGRQATPEPPLLTQSGGKQGQSLAAQQAPDLMLADQLSCCPGLGALDAV